MADQSVNNNFIKTILIAEDNPVNIRLNTIILNSIVPQAKLIQAEDGLSAINLFNKESIDMVFTDIQMDELNGYDLAKAIRKKDKKVPIFALTAGAISGEKQRCLDAGMNDMLTKPMVEDQVIEMLNHWISENSFSRDNLQVKEVDQHFDLRGLMELFDNPAELNELIDVALPILKNSALELTKNLKKKDINTLKRTAHYICGTARSLMLNQLIPLADQLQKISEEDTKAAERLVTEIKAEIDYLTIKVFNSKIT